MKDQRYKSNSLYRNAGLTLTHLSVVVLLSACGSGSGTPAETVATGNTSQSAAQLAQDGTTTLSLAQAAAAGLVPVESVTSTEQTDALVETGTELIAEGSDTSVSEPIDSNEPDTGAALPETEADNTSTDETPVDELPTSSTDTAPVETNNEGSDSATNTPAPAAANTTPVKENTVNANGEFEATNTEGFYGKVLEDGVVQVRWLTDPTARGYNVYRQAEYITTVFSEEYIDNDTFDESYYYEVQAFDYDENYNTVATGLTVDVTGTGRVNPESPTVDQTVLDGYELVFSDEFNGTELDSSKWVTQYLWGDALVINSEEQHYVDVQNRADFGYNPFSFDGEALTISSIPTPDNLKDKAYGQKYLSGVITSYEAFKFTYGYVEARAQVPFGQGLWPALWLLNAYYVDDKPEIDIMEFIGDDQDTVYHTYHYYDADGELRSTKSEPTVGIDFTNGYHTYGVEWLPGTVHFYVDGIKRHTISDSKVSQQDMYIIANTALGGWWPGSPDSSTPFPAEFKIDYIRAYQKAGGPLQADPNAGLPSKLLLWDDVPGASPGHLPPFELWPTGYPEKQ